MTTDVELEAAAEHIHYEYWMLVELRWAIYLLEDDADRWQRNAYLEAFAIHYRALRDFFYPTTPRKGDMLAKHYFDVGRWEKIRPAESDALRAGRDRVGKEIAHLTYSRVRDEKSVWLYFRIADDMRTVMAAFFSEIDKALLGKWAPAIEALLHLPDKASAEANA